VRTVSTAAPKTKASSSVPTPNGSHGDCQPYGDTQDELGQAVKGTGLVRIATEA